MGNIFFVRCQLVVIQNMAGTKLIVKTLYVDSPDGGSTKKNAKTPSIENRYEKLQSSF